jgi:hypothetical protein
LFEEFERTLQMGLRAREILCALGQHSQLETRVGLPLVVRTFTSEFERAPNVDLGTSEVACLLGQDSELETCIGLTQTIANLSKELACPLKMSQSVRYVIRHHRKHACCQMDMPSA